MKANHSYLRTAQQPGISFNPSGAINPWGTGSLQDRFEVVRPLIVGPSVLAVGCASRYGKPDWLHGLLRAAVPALVGIDINEATIRELQGQGYDARVGDAQDFNLGQTFDTVFAGELIEHLDNFHGFLQSVRRDLSPGGRLVLTTPNAFYVGNFLYRWGGHGQVHPEHTCWLCEDTLRSLLERNGFSAVNISFTGHTSPTTGRRAATFMARHTLPPRLAFDTIVAVASIG